MQVQDHPPQGGLAAAGLAHDAQGFAGLDAERDSVHGVERALAGLEIFFQVFDS